MSDQHPGGWDEECSGLLVLRIVGHRRPSRTIDAYESNARKTVPQSRCSVPDTSLNRPGAFGPVACAIHTESE